MRLIDADALDGKLENLAKKYADMGRFEVAKDYSFAQTVLLTAPTIYPESLRPKGRWIKDKDGDEYCENCSRYMPSKEVTGDPSATNYCPNCGAKMEV